MVYFCKFVEYFSQTAKAKMIVFHILFCIWMTSSGIHICTMKQLQWWLTTATCYKYLQVSFCHFSNLGLTTTFIMRDNGLYLGYTAYQTPNSGASCYRLPSLVAYVDPGKWIATRITILKWNTMMMLNMKIH